MEERWIPAQPGHAEQMLLRLPDTDGVLREGDLLYRLGRDAIYHGLRALLHEAPADGRRTLLLPAFHCAAQVDAAEAAGMSCEFFSVGPGAVIDVGRLARCIHDDVRALMVVHYFGWPLDLGPLAHLARERRVALLEDCALALFSTRGGQSVGNVGDFSIFSLRKFLPVRDGGILRLNRPGLSADVPERRPSSLRPAAGAIGRALGAGRLVALAKRVLGPHRDKPQGGDRPQDGDRPRDRGNSPAERAPDFVAEEADQSISAFARYVARRVRPAEIVARRRRNYRFLQDRLADHPRYVPLFHELPEGVCPLSLVLLHPQRGELEASLLEQDVETYCFGRNPHPRLDPGQFPEARVLWEQSIAVPTHQELGQVELERVAAALRRAL